MEEESLQCLFKDRGLSKKGRPKVNTICWSTGDDVSKLKGEAAKVGQLDEVVVDAIWTNRIGFHLGNMEAVALTNKPTLDSSMKKTEKVDIKLLNAACKISANSLLVNGHYQGAECTVEVTIEPLQIVKTLHSTPANDLALINDVLVLALKAGANQEQGQVKLYRLKDFSELHTCSVKHKETFYETFQAKSRILAGSSYGGCVAYVGADSSLIVVLVKGNLIQELKQNIPNLNHVCVQGANIYAMTSEGEIGHFRAGYGLTRLSVGRAEVRSEIAPDFYFTTLAVSSGSIAASAISKSTKKLIIALLRPRSFQIMDMKVFNDAKIFPINQLQMVRAGALCYIVATEYYERVTTLVVVKGKLSSVDERKRLMMEQILGAFFFEKQKASYGLIFGPSTFKKFQI
jgi:hypothetical protein